MSDFLKASNASKAISFASKYISEFLSSNFNNELEIFLISFAKPAKTNPRTASNLFSVLITNSKLLLFVSLINSFIFSSVNSLFSNR